MFIEPLPSDYCEQNASSLPSNCRSFFFNPLLFASCTNTFSKCCEITTTTDMKRSAQ
jgi:hypothetical protein